MQIKDNYRNGLRLMISNEKNTDRRKHSFVLPEDARNITDKKLEAWDVSKSGVASWR